MSRVMTMAGTSMMPPDRTIFPLTVVMGGVRNALGSSTQGGPGP